MIKVTAMTTMCVDIFDSTGEIFPGGEALNFAAVACDYPHIKVGIMGAVGDDEYGEAVLNSIQNKSIDKRFIHIIKNGITASNRIYLTPDGDRYFKENSWNSGVYGDFCMSDEDIEILKCSDIVFINYYSPNFREVLELKKINGFKLAVDFSEARNFDELEKIVPYIDFFFISGEECILPVFRSWSEKYEGIFNVTLAENGSVTFNFGKEYRVKAVPVTEIVDTTGCGDSYHAAFICSYAKDKDIISAMEEGAAVASKTLSHIGGF